jgi:hypothetical protein
MPKPIKKTKPSRIDNLFEIIGELREQAEYAILRMDRIEESVRTLARCLDKIDTVLLKLEDIINQILEGKE